jgi:hypothetical protein
MPESRKCDKKKTNAWKVKGRKKIMNIKNILGTAGHRGCRFGDRSGCHGSAAVCVPAKGAVGRSAEEGRV